MRLKIASRKSDLARWQAHQVAKLIKQHPSKPEIEFIYKASAGDLNLDVSLESFGSKGAFTQDFLEDLVKGDCDLVVHSWKDLPVEERSDTQVVMTLPRADLRDVFLVPEDVWVKAVNLGVLKVLTSSPRRVYNLKSLLPQLLPADVKVEFVPVRGNVPTRLTKMHQLKAGLILAKAGLDRLLEAEAEGFLKGEVQIQGVIKDCRFMVLPLSFNPPAPAQGALAIEVARQNSAVSNLCQSLSDTPVFKAVERERAMLKRYGGGCHQKIGVAILPRSYGHVVSLRGQTDSGEILSEWKIENNLSWTKAESNDHIFPLKPQDNSWFERIPLEIDLKSLAKVSALMVARADAWPRGYLAPLDQVVWTAGVKSWTKLAQARIWVNGCADNLGEDEDPNLSILKPGLKWRKLTHSQAAGPEDFAIYQLKPFSKPVVDLSHKTHFYWMSRTSFEQALKLFPEAMARGHHSCGPGSTHQFLKNHLKRDIKVFLNHEQFISESVP